MKLKDSAGWFAADRRMLQALYLLSDGAFKLFVYISVSADRTTGKLRVAQGVLARAVRKSRGSIASYLDELSKQGVCVITPAANQHQAGEIEISDAFWPYHKETAESVDESRFVQEVHSRLLEYPIVRSSFGAADQKVARELFNKGVSLEHFERALLLGLTRKYVSSLNSLSTSTIYSLSYFLPLLDEVAQTETADRYWEYLRRRLDDLNAAWLDRSRSSQRASESGKGADVGRQDLSAEGVS